MRSKSFFVDGDPKPRDSGERRGLTTGASVGDFR
jgi:hypothetical protein